MVTSRYEEHSAKTFGAFKTFGNNKMTLDWKRFYSLNIFLISLFPAFLSKTNTAKTTKIIKFIVTSSYK